MDASSISTLQRTDRVGRLPGLQALLVVVATVPVAAAALQPDALPGRKEAGAAREARSVACKESIRASGRGVNLGSDRAYSMGHE